MSSDPHHTDTHETPAPAPVAQPEVDEPDEDTLPRAGWPQWLRGAASIGLGLVVVPLLPWAFLKLGIDGGSALAYTLQIGGPLIVALLALIVSDDAKADWIRRLYRIGFWLTAGAAIMVSLQVGLYMHNVSQQQIINSDPVLKVAVAEQQKLDNRDAILGADIAKAINQTEAPPTNQVAKVVYDSHQAKPGWTAKVLNYFTTTSHDQRTGLSMSEKLLMVPFWEAAIYLAFALCVSIGGAWLIVESFRSTIFGKGVDKPREGLKGVPWFTAWTWYIIDRFIVRWGGKFAVFALMMKAFLGVGDWYMPDHPLPGSPMYIAENEQKHNADTSHTPASNPGAMSVARGRPSYCSDPYTASLLPLTCGK